MQRIFLTLLLLAVFVPSVNAQIDLPNDKKAIFCIDAQVARLLESKLAESMGEEELKALKDGMDLPVLPQKYVRIFGMVGAPDSMQEAQQMGPGRDLPFELVFEFQMADAESAAAVLDYMSLDKDNSQEIDGVTYFSPPGFAPQNIVGGVRDEKVVVFGTKNFVFANSRKELFSAELANAWGRHLSHAPVRASLEMVSKADLIAEMVAMGEQGAPPPFVSLLGMVDNMESLNLTMDVDGEELLALRGLGKNDADAEELRGGIDGLLAIAKLASGGMKQGMQQKSPNAAAMMDEIMGDLKTIGEGKEVNIVINRPESFEAGVAELQAVVRSRAQVTIRTNNMRQALLAMHNFDAANNGLPFDADPTQPSWRAKISEFMDEKEGEMPQCFGSDGENSMIPHVRTEKQIKSFIDLTDGSSNTICMVEVSEGIPWKSNKDVTPAQVIEMIGNLGEGEVMVVGFYDASVIAVDSSTDLELNKKMCTPDGGEVIDFEDLERLYSR